jgi:hypothetical protein
VDTVLGRTVLTLIFVSSISATAAENAADSRADTDITKVAGGFSLDGWGIFTSAGPDYRRGGIFYSPSREWEFGLSATHAKNKVSTKGERQYDQIVDDLAADMATASQELERPRRKHDDLQETVLYTRYSPLRYLSLHSGLGYRNSEIHGFASGYSFGEQRTYGGGVTATSNSAILQLGLASDYDISLKGLIGFDWNVVLGVDYLMASIPFWTSSSGSVAGGTREIKDLPGEELGKTEARKITVNHPSFRAAVRF